MPESIDRCWSRIGVGGDATCPRLDAAGHCRNCEEYIRAGRTLFDREVPPGIREDWARQLAEPEAVALAGGESLVVFEACGEYFAIPILLLRRVTKAGPVHSLPSRSNSVFTGLVNMDGELLPCFSVAAALELTGAQTTSGLGRMLLLANRETRLVCGVDRVIGVFRIAPAGVEPPPVTISGTAQALTTAVVQVKDRRAGLLDPDKLMHRLMNSTGL